jgi:nucleoside-diphosphate kinase
MAERTLSIIKPEAVQRGLIGQILSRFEASGLKIVGARLLRLTQDQAEAFYAVHKERPFYSSLTRYMSSGPILVSVLQGEGAIAKNRRSWGQPIQPKPYRGRSGAI